MQAAQLSASCTRSQLVDAFDELLQPALFRDYGPNGLQIEGRHQVGHLVSGVTASLALIDAAIAKQERQGSFDLIADYAEPLPVAVIAELLGVPEGGRAQFLGDERPLNTTRAAEGAGGLRVNRRPRNRPGRQPVRAAGGVLIGAHVILCPKAQQQPRACCT